MSKGFLKIAEELYELGKKSRGEKREFLFRSAISRAYYSVLWYIRDFYKIAEEKDLHSSVMKVVIRNHSGFLQNQLNKLRLARIDSDYKIRTFKVLKGIEKNQTIYYIKLAKSIIKMLESEGKRKI